MHENDKVDQENRAQKCRSGVGSIIAHLVVREKEGVEEELHNMYGVLRMRVRKTGLRVRTKGWRGVDGFRVLGGTRIC